MTQPLDPNADEEPGENEIPMTCDRCGSTWLWHLDQPHTMTCPSCDIEPEDDG